MHKFYKISKESFTDLWVLLGFLVIIYFPKRVTHFVLYLLPTAVQLDLKKVWSWNRLALLLFRSDKY